VPKSAQGWLIAVVSVWAGSWLWFPVLFLLGPTGSGVISEGDSIVLHAVADVSTKIDGARIYLRAKPWTADCCAILHSVNQCDSKQRVSKMKSRFITYRLTHTPQLLSKNLYSMLSWILKFTVLAEYDAFVASKSKNKGAVTQAAKRASDQSADILSLAFTSGTTAGPSAATPHSGGEWITAEDAVAVADTLISSIREQFEFTRVTVYTIAPSVKAARRVQTLVR